MAEDILLRLRGENADLRAKLAEATADVAALKAEVDGLNQTGSGAGSPIKALADEADVLGFNIEQITRETEGFGASVVRGFDFQQVKQFAQGVASAGVEIAKQPPAYDKINTLLNGAIDRSGKLGAIISKISPELGFIVSKFGAWGIAIAAVVGTLKGASVLLEKIVDLSGATGKHADYLRAALHDMANPLSFLKGESEAWKIALGRVNEEWTVVTQRTQDAANAQEILTEFTRRHAEAQKEVKEGIEEQAAAFEKFTAAAAGFSIEGAKTEIAELLLIAEELRKLDLLAPGGPFAAELLTRVTEITKAVDIYGTKLEEKLGVEQVARLRALRDELQQTTDWNRQFAQTQQQLVKDTANAVLALESEIAALERTQQAMSDLEATTLDGTSKIRAAFAQLDQSLEPKRVVQLQEEISGLEEEYNALSDTLLVNVDADQQRLDIEEKIRILEGQLADERRAAADEYHSGSETSIQLQNDFRQVLADAESQIQDLPANVRGAMQALVDRFQHQNEVIGASGEAVEEFEVRFKAAMAQAQSALGGVGDRARAELGEARQQFLSVAEASGTAVADIRAQWSGLNGILDGTIARLQQIAALQFDAATAAEEAI